MHELNFLDFVETREGGFLSLAVETSVLDCNLDFVRIAGACASRIHCECSTCRHIAVLLFGCNSECSHNDNMIFVKLFFADNTAKLSHIYISVGIDLYVLSVTSKQQVEYMIAIEVTHPAPTVCRTDGTPLHLLVIVWINAVQKTARFYCLRHVIIDQKLHIIRES